MAHNQELSNLENEIDDLIDRHRKLGKTLQKLKGKIRKKKSSASQTSLSIAKNIRRQETHAKPLPLKKNAKTAPKKAAAKKPTVLDAVYRVIGKSRNGATIADLKKKTGLSPRQLSNALYKLSVQGKLVARSRGLYVKK